VLLVLRAPPGLENTVGSGIDRHGRHITPADDSVAVDHEQRALANAAGAVIGAIFPRDVAFGFEVGQQRKVKLAVLREGEMAPHAVDRNPENLGAEFAKLRQHLVVERHLVAADGAPVGRIKGEDERLAPKIAERHGLIGRHLQFEIWSRSACSKSHVRIPYPYFDACFRSAATSRPVMRDADTPKRAVT
jgi:hypothetical protein